MGLGFDERGKVRGLGGGGGTACKLQRCSFFTFKRRVKAMVYMHLGTWKRNGCQTLISGGGELRRSGSKRASIVRSR